MTDTRTAELAIRRHMDDGWHDFVAHASVDLEEDGEGGYTYDDVLYSVASNQEITLTADEKDQLNRMLDLSEDEDISEEDFEAANPEEDEAEETAEDEPSEDDKPRDV
jgi:hypothetical protein